MSVIREREFVLRGAFSIKLKIRCVLQTGLRSIVLAEHPIGKKFDFEPGDLLNGIPVREVGIPRMTDKDGKQKYNCWGLSLRMQWIQFILKKEMLWRLLTSRKKRIEKVKETDLFSDGNRKDCK